MRAAKSVNYVGAGTVEFLLDSTGHFYFMEMNTRLQVEHPVTEMITGQDLVEWQLKVANGEPLPLAQSELTITGHAFEARIYAEDPDNEFLPAAGKLTWLQQPVESAHVRIDTGVIQDDEVGVFYDPMIAKLVVWDENRGLALQRLAQALATYRIIGATTNIDFLHRLATHKAFAAEELSTDFIKRNETVLFETKLLPIESFAPLAGLYLTLRRQSQPTPTSDRTSPWHACDNWRTNAAATSLETIVVGKTDYIIRTAKSGPDIFEMNFENTLYTVSGSLEGNNLIATVNGHRQTAVAVEGANTIALFTSNGTVEFTTKVTDLGEEVDEDDGSGFKAPMNGSVVNIFVTKGDTVSAGDTLLIMEAMKMEHAIKAPVDGLINEIFYSKGDLVDGGADLLAFEPVSSGNG